MKGERKFLLALLLSSLLVGLVILNNGLGEAVTEKLANYTKRRVYYERVISRKGLSLHEGQYWREKE
jgi:hypothetical protein